MTASTRRSATRSIWPLTQAQFLRGWLATHGADIDTGFEEMLRVSLESASNVMRPIFLGLVAARQINAARLEDATKTLERATKDIREQQARFYGTRGHPTARRGFAGAIGS